MRGAEKHLRGIQAHPQDYVDLWSLDEFEGVTQAQIRELATRLLDQISEVLTTPPKLRGQREWRQDKTNSQSLKITENRRFKLFKSRWSSLYET